MPCSSGKPTVSSVRPETLPTVAAGRWLWRRGAMAWMLWPLSLVFCALVRLRRWLYRIGWFRSSRPAVPLIVVGNLSVGGQGKTPVVQALSRIFDRQGRRVGLLTRGYKSDYEGDIRLLEQGQTHPAAGDEANMLSELTGLPIAVGADRVAAAEALLRQHPELDLLISDDGLQHYRLGRDIEIAVQRPGGYGNRFCLPAGPLREPLSRLNSVDLVIDRGSEDVREQLGDAWNLLDASRRRPLSDFVGQPVHALAGIGFPESFFDGLREAGLNPRCQAFPDHHDYSAMELRELVDQPLLVTHKDAVKLRPIAEAQGWHDIWVVPLELELSDAVQSRLMQLLETKTRG